MGFFGAAHEKAHPTITGSLYNILLIDFIITM